MIRWIGVFCLSCLALPALFAQQPDVDELGKRAVRSLNAAADELEAIFKNPPDAKVIEETKTRLKKDFDDIGDKIEKLPPASRQALKEKYGKDLKAADDRFQAAVEKLNPTSKPESPDVIAKRIAENNEKAVERLNKNDPGKDTQEIQKKISEDLKKLLDQNDPNGGGGGGGQGNDGGAQGNSGGAQGNQGGNQGNKGGNQGNKGGNQGNKGGDQGKDPMGKDPKDDPKGDGNGGGKPNEKGGKGGNGKGGKGPEGKTKNPDIKIGEWGNFPERQPRSWMPTPGSNSCAAMKNSCRQYYRAIAEQSRSDR